MSRRPSRILLSTLLLLLVSRPSLAQVSFFQPPTYAGGEGNVFVADFNGDGKPDLLASDGTLNLGAGNGTFTLGTPVSGTPLAVADFNGDGKADILEQGNGTLLVLLGNGDGTFQPAISTTTGVSFVASATADLNGDGKADVVAVYGSFLFIYLSKGDGTFAPGVSYSLGTTSLSSAVLSLGDLNGDGKIDVIVSASGATSGAAGEEITFLGNGDGTLQAAKTSPGITGPGHAATGDFNRDGKLDLAIEGCSGTYCSQAVFVLLGNGDGTFQPPTMAFSSTGGPVAAADVNADGNLDLVAGGSAAEIFLGDGHGSFSNASNYVSSFGNAGLAIADFNLDGKLDIATGNTVLLGNGKGTFPGVPLGALPGTPALGTTLGVVWGTPAATGDFDKNGTVDVVTITNSSPGTTSISIFSNNGAGVLSLIHSYSLQQPAWAVVAADFNGDGNLDLLAIGSDPTSTSWSYSVLLGNGDGSFQSPVFYPQSVAIASTFQPVVVADFNGDQRPDFAVAAGNQSLAVLLGKGDGTFSSPVYYFEGGQSPLLAADFNSDGKLDIAVGAGAGVGSGILFGKGDGTFQTEFFPPNLNNFNALFTGDVNSDGKADLLSSTQVALGNGDGTFNVLTPLPGGVNVVAMADINQDSKLDLLTTRLNGVILHGVGVELGNGDGTFGPYIDINLLEPLGTGLPNKVLTADMNGDGLPDIVFPWFGGVGVLLNTTHATAPPDFQLFGSALSPTSVSAGNSVMSTIKVVPLRGFTGNVALSCTGLPSGATCSFNPGSISAGSGISTLTVATLSSLPAGLYTVVVTAVSGTISHIVPLTVTVTADFTIGLASGSSSPQAISAGQNASFSLVFAAAGSFTGTVNLNCRITPVVSPAPTCSLPSSVQINSSGTQTATVQVATTAPSTTHAVPNLHVPSGTMPLTWTLTVLSLGLILLLSRKRVGVLAAPAMVLTLASSMSCGAAHTKPGTPSGTYAVTITATSGSLSHDTVLQVIVQ